MSYDKAIGRHRVFVYDDGFKQHEAPHGAYIEYQDGWNDACPRRKVTLSVDELRDLRYLIDRALEAARALSPTGEGE